MKQSARWSRVLVTRHRAGNPSRQHRTEREGKVPLANVYITTRHNHRFVTFLCDGSTTCVGCRNGCVRNWYQGTGRRKVTFNFQSSWRKKLNNGTIIMDFIANFVQSNTFNRKGLKNHWKLNKLSPLNRLVPLMHLHLQLLSL